MASKDTQDIDFSALSPDEQLKVSEQQTQRVYDQNLSYIDWSTLPKPTTQAFKPFFFFCPQGLYTKHSEFSKLVAGMKQLKATRLISGSQKEAGFAWEFKDADAASKIAAGVPDLKTGKVSLGWDIVAVEGKLQSCRVPIVAQEAA
jgi:hypothetical protein